VHSDQSPLDNQYSGDEETFGLRVSLFFSLPLSRLIVIDIRHHAVRI